MKALAGRDAEAELARLREDTTLPFSLERLGIERSPLAVAPFTLEGREWPHRINQCLIKGRGTEQVELGPFRSAAAADLVDACIGHAESARLDWRSRYLYLTIDTAPAPAGSTQRVPGWHFDDLQGADIVQKQPGGFLYLAMSVLPSEYALQSFDTTGADERVHNLFDWCARQVRPDAVHPTWVNTLILLSAYDVHRGVPARDVTPRVFVRLLFTHCQLTSVKTTLNPAMAYDHTPHSTSGRIPPHLV